MTRAPVRKLAAPDVATRLARFAVEVRTRRAALGMRLRQCAALTGVSKGTICRVEHGERMSAETYLRLAAWLEG